MLEDKITTHIYNNFGLSFKDSQKLARDLLIMFKEERREIYKYAYEQGRFDEKIEKEYKIGRYEE